MCVKSAITNERRRAVGHTLHRFPWQQAGQERRQELYGLDQLHGLAATDTHDEEQFSHLYAEEALLEGRPEVWKCTGLFTNRRWW